ncbi:hypothetical protein MLD38_035314 [Melastoma candidum]|uniref:Uncharacterized protein n=1 Tax=Melastoma candidum TaxID=119954 RepID=A0ACB9MD70_9MYRT|nr:hypothetical protein MLD38_035314 [Melastoma candidum]
MRHPSNVCVDTSRGVTIGTLEDDPRCVSDSIFRNELPLRPVEPHQEQLLQILADAKIELANLMSALGEKNVARFGEETSGTIKEQLESIAHVLEQLWKLKEERVNEFSNVQSKIQKTCSEISGSVPDENPVVNEADLSLKKLDEYKDHLKELEKEKSDRLQKVLEFVRMVHHLCMVLGMDFFSTVTEVHPSLNTSRGGQSKSISNDTLARLTNTVLALKEDKKQRLQKLQQLAGQLIELWNLMETSDEERRHFNHVTHNISSSVDEVTASGAPALDIIEQAEVEVGRLDQLKASRMKEIAFRKQDELEEIFAQAHVEVDPEAAREKIMELIESGNVEPAELLADMDNKIGKAREEALSRKETLDKVEKWMSACEEESWLEDYNRDDNRYSAGRGAHLNLKRAEKARILVNKIPKREEEKRRLRDQKKFHEQQSSEQESVSGARPSPARLAITKKVTGPHANGGANGTPGRRLSLQNGIRSAAKDGKRDSRLSAPVNYYVAMSKEDAASHVSGTEPIPASP